LFPDSVYQALLRHGFHPSHFAPDIWLGRRTGSWIVDRRPNEPCDFLREDQGVFGCVLFDVPEFRAFWSTGCAWNGQFRDVLEAFQTGRVDE
jgi:hypothetical protein